MRTRPIALVTGATGFVGSHVAACLTRSGWEVHAIRRRTSLMPRADDLSSVAWHENNTMADLGECLQAVRPDVVFHLASQFITEHKCEDIDVLIRSNVLFGVQLLEAMKHAGVRRIISAGSSWQHYEGHSYCPVNLYAATKEAFEVILQYYVQAEGFHAIVLELFETYGPRDTRGKLLGALIEAAKSGKPIALSPGQQQIDLVHVTDVANAFQQAAARAGDASTPGLERFRVASEQAISIRDLVRLVERVAGKPISAEWGARAYRRREVMRPAQLGALLPGWGCKITLQEGIRVLLQDACE